MVEELKDSYSVVLSPKVYPSTEEEIKSGMEYLKPEYAYKLSAVSLEDFVDTMISIYQSIIPRFMSGSGGDTWSLDRWI